MKYIYILISKYYYMGKKKQLAGSLSHGRLQCYNI
jgi:hypothetical protein